jgi:Ser/Thr protein kinase RdoA (MazF antagonist)
LLAALAGQPITLIHGDAWRGNLNWDADRPVWIDWAGCSRAPAVADRAERATRWSRR